MPKDPITRLEDLEDLLMTLPSDAMLASTLDGFIAGILVCPEPVPPEKWVLAIFDADVGESPASVFESEEQAEKIVDLITEHCRATSRALLAGGYTAAFDVDTPHDETIWETWTEGFARAMEMQPASWLSIADADDVARDALAGLKTLIELADDTSALTQEEIDQLNALAPTLIPVWVNDLYAWKITQSLPDPATSTPARSQKIGRNEPCPCGSGRKYKKCCGAN